MTDRDLFKQALEALEWEWGGEPIGTLTWGAITALRERLADTTHTCSYHCERPECVRAQRDELRERVAREELAQVSPLEFNHMTLDKEHMVGKPIFWAEWPNREQT